MKQSEQIRYLLGLCSPAEREQIEAEYFSNADAFQQMLAAEDDLIDAYARGELTVEERRGFETHFLKSSRGRERVQFARAFAGSVSEARSDARQLPTIEMFRGWSRTARIAAIAAVIVVVVVLSWFVLDRRRMSNELRELRAKSVELSREAEAAEERANAERARAAELTAELQNRRAQSEKPREQEAATTRHQINPPPTPKRIKGPAETTTNTPPPEAIRLKREAVAEFRVTSTSNSKKTENVPGETVNVIAGSAEVPVNPSEASLGSTFVNKKITALPLEARNIPSLLSLQTATTRDGYVADSRADQSSITLDGVNINESPETPADPFGLSQRFRIANRPTTLHVPNTATWIRFKLDLATFARHTDYRVTLQSADGAEIESVDWVEPLTPNQDLIETPIIRTAFLVSGDYNLLLLGKEPNGVFVRVGLYPFKLIKD